MTYILLFYGKLCKYRSGKSPGDSLLEYSVLKKERTCTLAGMLIACMLVFFLAGCSSAGKVKQYKFTASFEGTTTDNLRADEALEGGKTYRVFFTLTRPEDCVRISVKAREIPRDGLFVPAKPRIYIVAERAVDLRKFPKREKDFVYSELGRNYTQNWEYLDYLLVCGSPESHLKSLNPGVFRLRLTSLDNTDYAFTVTIDSDNGAVVFSRMFQ